MCARLHFSKKLQWRPTLVVNSSAASSSGHSLFVVDEISGRRFLVDTGAARSVFPANNLHFGSLASDPSVTLVAANGSNISTFGVREIPLRFGGAFFSWRFLLAAVNQPLLGADFLAEFELLVDVAQRRLINATTFSSIPLITAPAPSPNVFLLNTAIGTQRF